MPPVLAVERARFDADSNGDLVLVTGDIVFSGSGKGINLGVTSNTDSNTLDDYEEGTWTPAWVPTSGGWSGTFNAARYVKIGSMVWAGFTFTASAQATGTKMNGLSGLPFSAANTGLRAVPSVALSQVGLTDYIMSIRVANNLATIDTSMGRQGTGGQSEFLPAHTHASSQVSMTVCYQTA